MAGNKRGTRERVHLTGKSRLFPQSAYGLHVMATNKQVVSLLYFLSFAAMACCGRFSAIFFRDGMGLHQ